MGENDAGQLAIASSVMICNVEMFMLEVFQCACEMEAIDMVCNVLRKVGPTFKKIEEMNL